MKKPVVGDTLFAVKRFRAKSEFYPVTITKIGRIYVHLKFDFYLDVKIDAAMFLKDTVHYSDYEIYDSEQAYKDSLKLLDVKREAMDLLLKVKSLDKVQKAIEVLS